MFLLCCLCFSGWFKQVTMNYRRLQQPLQLLGCKGQTGQNMDESWTVCSLFCLSVSDERLHCCSGLRSSLPFLTYVVGCSSNPVCSRDLATQAGGTAETDSCCKCHRNPEQTKWTASVPRLLSRKPELVTTLAGWLVSLPLLCTWVWLHFINKARKE